MDIDWPTTITMIVAIAGGLKWGLSSLNKRFDSLNKRFDKIDDKLDNLSQRVAHIEGKLDIPPRLTVKEKQ